MLFELTLTIFKLLVQLKIYNNLNCHLFKLFVNYLNCLIFFIYYFYGKWKSASYLTQKLDIEIGTKRKHKLYNIYAVV